MPKRTTLVRKIQALSKEEGMRQPPADEWLANQDRATRAAETPDDQPLAGDGDSKADEAEGEEKA